MSEVPLYTRAGVLRLPAFLCVGRSRESVSQGPCVGPRGGRAGSRREASGSAAWKVPTYRGTSAVLRHRGARWGARWGGGLEGGTSPHTQVLHGLRAPVPDTVARKIKR